MLDQLLSYTKNQLMTGPWRRQLILVPLGYVTELNAFADPEVSPYNPLTK